MLALIYLGLGVCFGDFFAGAFTGSHPLHPGAQHPF
jgi:hypothetical protein